MTTPCSRRVSHLPAMTMTIFWSPTMSLRTKVPYGEVHRPAALDMYLELTVLRERGTALEENTLATRSAWTPRSGNVVSAVVRKIDEATPRVGNAPRKPLASKRSPRVVLPKPPKRTPALNVTVRKSRNDAPTTRAVEPMPQKRSSSRPSLVLRGSSKT